MVYCWADLYKIINSDDELVRDATVQHLYDIHIAKLKSREISVDRFVCDSLFSDGRRYAITLNNYPYNVEQGVYHYVFWINPNTQISEDNMLHISKSLLGDVLYRENPDRVKSVKTVMHYHLFSKVSPDKVMGLQELPKLTSS